MTNLGARAAKYRLWDWPVRLCHWSIVALVVGCWWTIEQGQVLYHSYCAYALLGVVSFRIYWGFVGSAPARFSHFLVSPARAFGYARNLGKRDTPPSAGHNPLGGYSAVLLLVLLLAQIGLGLFSIDVDGFDGGPFMDVFTFKTSRMITDWHALGFDVLLGLIGLHLLAITYYLLWRRQNLTAAMIHGRAPVQVDYPRVNLGRVFFGIVLSAALVWIIQ